MAVKDRLAGVPVLGTALAVQQRYKQDASDQLAAAIGFFAFLSLFPLMVLAVAVAGFVLTDPAEQARVVSLVTGSIPGFEATLGEGDTGVARLVANVVDNRGTIGVVGVVTLVLTGLRVVTAATAASTIVFRARVPTGIGAKLRQLLVMVVLGVLALAAVAASSLAGAPADLLPRWVAVLLAAGVTFVLDALLFLAAYRLLRGDAAVTGRDLLPGAVLAAVGWTVLKVAGASYVGSRVEGANALYGALGGVIALLLLLYLAGRLYLYGAQLSAVLVERRAGPLDGDAGDEDEAGRAAAGDRGAAARPAPADAGAPTPGSSGTAGASASAAAPRGAPPGAGTSVAPRGVPPGAGTSAAGPALRALPSRAASPAVGERTRTALAAAEARRGPGGDLRAAAGFALGAAALAAAWRFLRED